MRKVSASEGRLIAEASGEIEKEEGVLVIKRIHVRLKLKVSEAERETAERVHGFYRDRCAVYRSLRAAIAITTELIFEPVDG
ncbi:MAG TPA: OsmC family protein [Thermoanaerobaculia bacterium]|nr:OsmC family protein [Thermoanaerobaculia bacterium]